MGPLIYLAGPIARRSYQQATDWRVEATVIFGGHMFGCLDPMRVKHHLKGHDSIPDRDLDHEERQIFERDLHDVRQASACFAYLLGAQSMSGGTQQELGMFRIQDKPIVIVIENEGNPNDCLFLRQCTAFRTNNFEVGIDLMRFVLGCNA